MKPYFILLLPPLFWAGNFIVGYAIADQAFPISLSFWRWALSFLGSTMLLGVVVLLPLYLVNPFNEAGLLINQETIATLLYIALFPSIFAYLA